MNCESFSITVALQARTRGPVVSRTKDGRLGSNPICHMDVLPRLILYVILGGWRRCDEPAPRPIKVRRTLIISELTAEGDQIDQTIPYQTRPYQTRPYQTIPYQIRPDQTIQDHTIPYHTRSYQTRPHHTRQTYPQLLQRQTRVHFFRCV
jgi:hypothetical protein